MRVTSAVFAVVALATCVLVSGCSGPPSESHIRAAVVNYVWKRNCMEVQNTMQNKEHQASTEKLQKNCGATAKIVYFKSLGCAKSQISSGYVCTLSAVVSVTPKQSNKRAHRHLEHLDGSYLFYVNKEMGVINDGWDIASTSQAR